MSRTDPKKPVTAQYKRVDQKEPAPEKINETSVWAGDAKSSAFEKVDETNTRVTLIGERAPSRPAHTSRRFNPFSIRSKKPHKYQLVSTDEASGSSNDRKGGKKKSGSKSRSKSKSKSGSRSGSRSTSRARDVELEGEDERSLFNLNGGGRTGAAPTHSAAPIQSRDLPPRAPTPVPELPIRKPRWPLEPNPYDVSGIVVRRTTFIAAVRFEEERHSQSKREAFIKETTARLTTEISTAETTKLASTSSLLCCTPAVETKEEKDARIKTQATLQANALANKQDWLSESKRDYIKSAVLRSILLAQNVYDTVEMRALQEDTINHLIAETVSQSGLVAHVILYGLVLRNTLMATMALSFFYTYFTLDSDKALKIWIGAFGVGTALAPLMLESTWADSRFRQRAINAFTNSTRNIHTFESKDDPVAVDHKLAPQG